MTFRREGTPVRNYWLGREKTWRRLGILSPYREGRYMNRYDYARLWHEQRGRCGLCDKELIPERWEYLAGFDRVGVGRGISLDHAHGPHSREGLARGVLHGLCNRAAGSYSSNFLLLVLNYLLRHERRAEVPSG